MSAGCLHSLHSRRARRCADVSERLRGYTQGRKGAIFNRHNTFSLSGRAVGIGLYALANQFRADLTPALAKVLNMQGTQTIEWRFAR